jgi:dihydrolipoamide dehydrogenase
LETYDLVVIGGGPAGYVAAERAGAAGLRTVLVEKNALGGVCLNEGCIPSKTFLNSAKILHYALDGEKYGVSVAGASIDHNKVRERKNKVVKTLATGISAGLKHNGVTVKSGEGRIIGRHDSGFTVSAAGEEISARKILLASGSVPIIPPIPGLKEGISSGFVVTNRELFDLDKVPKRLLVIGGGVIGLEMASYFNAAGSEVTVIEVLPKIAGPTEAEVSELLLKNLQRSGIQFKLNSKVTSVGGGSVAFEENSKSGAAATDKILLSTGRRAFTDGLGLESVAVHTEKGAIPTDDRMMTNVSGVYAAGDVTGKSMFAHTAYREAEAAVNHMLGKRDPMRYGAIPSVIYTSPEVAGVGETEETARAKGMDVRAVNIPLRFSGRYVAEVEMGDGICKLIVDTKFNRLVGAHMIGSYTSEIVYGAAIMIEMEMRIDDIKEIVFPHPSVSEVIREALFAL